MVICIGPKGCGKTNLLEALTEENYIFDKITLPTVGNNIFTLKLKKPVKKKKTIDVREIGGALIPAWTDYISTEKDIIFLVDSSNLAQVSEASVLFTEVLEAHFVKADLSQEEESRRLCLVFSKVDALFEDDVRFIRHLMNLDTILDYHNITITEIQCSSKTKGNLDKLGDWIEESVHLPTEKKQKKQ
jgi:GTPase SAR1 family protein